MEQIRVSFYFGFQTLSTFCSLLSHSKDDCKVRQRQQRLITIPQIKSVAKLIEHKNGKIREYFRIVKSISNTLISILPHRKCSPSQCDSSSALCPLFRAIFTKIITLLSSIKRKLLNEKRKGYNSSWVNLFVYLLLQNIRNNIKSCERISHSITASSSFSHSSSSSAPHLSYHTDE